MRSIFKLGEDQLPPARKDYAKEVGYEPWETPALIMDAIDHGVRRLLVRSCNGAGKSSLLGTLASYELEHNEAVTVVCSGATATQLKNNLWKEVKRAVKKACLPVKQAGTQVTITDHRFAITINPARVESAQGYHNKRVVIILDEATSLSYETIQALFSCASNSDSLIVVTYNPINTDAFVYELEERAEAYNPEKQYDATNWVSFQISAFDHPNVKTGIEMIPGAVSREYVESMLAVDTIQAPPTTPGAIHVPWNNTYWHPTPEALARVCGEWSQAAQFGFIPMQAVIDCCKLERNPQSGLTFMGIDIAAGGDAATAFSIFKGAEEVLLTTLKTSDFGILCQETQRLANEYEVTAAAIDDTGVGRAVSDRLVESQATRFLVIPVNFAQKPKDFEKVRNPANARAEMYLCLEREIRSQQIKLLFDKERNKELGSTRIRTAKEPLHIEDKKLIEKRLGRSPDKADATALARYARRLFQYHNRPKFL